MNRMIFTTTMIYSVSLCGSHIQAHRSEILICISDTDHKKATTTGEKKEEPKKKLEKTSPLVRT